MDLNVEKYGIAPRDYPLGLFRERNYPVFTALSGILKIHGIAHEYKYYTVSLE